MIFARQILTNSDKSGFHCLENEMTNASEVWQVEANGQIYETNFAELAEWIGEGSLLPEDKVRRGNLRWLTAGKVPLLSEFFNAKELGIPAPLLPTSNDAAQSAENLPPPENFDYPQIILQDEFVQIIDETSTEIAKEVLQNEKQNKQNKNLQFDSTIAESLSFSDFAQAIIYPFRFKASLIFGAVMFMILTLGESVAAFGISMYFAAIVCFILANTLVFGCLANTLENFSQGKTNANFMPGFDEFSIWDDVVEPFFLSLAVYFISFGLLIILVAGAIWSASDSESKIEADKQKILSVVLPDGQKDLNSAEQISQISQFPEQLKPDNTRQSENLSGADDVLRSQQNAAKQAAELQKLPENIKQNLTAQKQSETIGNTETESFSQTAGTIMRLTLVYSVPVFLALLWGIFYFPVACAVAGYTRSFAAILNPAVCFDTVKRLGMDYVKIIGIFLIIVLSALGLNAILQTIFAPLNLPMLGNLPAKAVVSIFIFYLSIVFSVALGTTLFKASSRLNLYRG